MIDLLKRTIALIVSIITMLIAGKFMKHIDYVYTPDMNHIVDNIYIGNWADSTNWPVLNECGVTHILTLNKRRTPDIKAFEDQNIKHLFIYIDDNAFVDIAQYFDQCIDFIKNADVVLVHCSAGVSRSVSIVIAYLVKEKNMTVDEALDLIRASRPKANPNVGFMGQLRAFNLKLQQCD